MTPAQNENALDENATYDLHPLDALAIETKVTGVWSTADELHTETDFFVVR